MLKKRQHTSVSYQLLYKTTVIIQFLEGLRENTRDLCSGREYSMVVRYILLLKTVTINQFLEELRKVFRELCSGSEIARLSAIFSCTKQQLSISSWRA